MLLKDLCVLDVCCCTRETSVSAAAKIMRQQHVGDLVVVDDTEQDREPLGIITDRDIAIEVVAKNLDPAKTKVGEIMRTHIVIASGSEDSAVALQRMREHGVRRVPVVDAAGGVVGIITLDDMLRAHAEEATQLAEVASKERSRESRERR